MSRVYIGGLPERAGARDIEKLFEKYGRVRGINIKSGFAFIEYEDGRDADDAVYDLDGKPFMGERWVREESCKPHIVYNYFKKDSSYDLKLPLGMEYAG